MASHAFTAGTASITPHEVLGHDWRSLATSSELHAFVEQIDDAIAATCRPQPSLATDLATLRGLVVKHTAAVRRHRLCHGRAVFAVRRGVVYSRGVLALCAYLPIGAGGAEREDLWVHPGAERRRASGGLLQWRRARSAARGPQRRAGLAGGRAEVRTV